MRTNIFIDNKLMQQALRVSGCGNSSSYLYTQPLIDYQDHREQYIGHLYAMNYYKEHGYSTME